MPLKSLELYNFKSYKGTQLIDFGDSPFICVIGPNGAGKSNLMDAISFVLGVKSAQLRSTQLRDLVYRGRHSAENGMDVDDQEPSLTQDGMQARTAHVTATYEDATGKDWHFRRSIAPSGQSSYTLNGKDVSWKAYNAQLEKFNILTKAKNFLVFQGDVENIAIQDSRVLANLIDRISGSLDYEKDYELARVEQLKAADASSANYSRKRTLITEAKHFKEQKEDLQQWERLQNRHDAAVKKLFLWRLYHLTQEINSRTKEVESATERLSELRDEVQRGEDNLNQARSAHGEAQLKVKKREKAVKEGEKALEDKKPELVAVDAQIEHSTKKMTEAQKIADRVAQDRERQQQGLEELRKGQRDIEDRMKEAAESQRKNLRAAGSLSGEDLAEYQKLRSAANLVAVSERRQVETLQREEKTLRDAVAMAEDRMQQADRRLSSLNEEVQQTSSHQRELQARLDNLRNDRESDKARLDQAVAERQRINIKETELNEKLQDVFGKLLSAGADKRESEREKKMREVINNLKRIFPGVHGRVIELCKPTARKYDTAVATILGRHVDAIVVEHEQTAIDCIEYMRNQRAGQATFIPLDTIQTKPVQEKFRNFTKGARLAIDCIEFEPAVERAMQHACSSSLICDTMEVARYVCYEKHQEVKAVTLDGTVIHKSGLITGGTSSGSSRKFNDSDVENLQKAKESYLQQLRDLQKSASSAKDDDALLDRLARLDAEIKVVSESVSAVTIRLQDLKAEQDNLRTIIKNGVPEEEKARKSLRATQVKLDKVLRVVQDADDKVFQALCAKIGVQNIREYEDVQLKIAQAESEAMAAFAAQKARVKHQIDFEATQLDNTENRLSSLESFAEKSRQRLEELEREKATIQKELEQIRQTIRQARSKLEAAVQGSEQALQKVDRVRESSREMSRLLDKALRNIAGWNDEISKSASDRHAIYKRCRLENIELPLVRGRLDKVPLDAADTDLSMDTDEDTQRPVVTEDYGIEPDFRGLDEEDRENDQEDFGKELEEEIGRSKAELERTVPNLKALDRLADVEGNLSEAEKEAELTRQETKRARDHFQELKKKRCDLFNAAFRHMSNCIDSIYKDLTKTDSKGTGGVAFLSLEDADEPYLSGVKYNVMPPGKPFIETEQLSGGEKTMAALALLFAIHSFHPAPFFVLDEVDAALDATNVSKLARYVRAQAESQVQFLIISLKPNLYQRADGLVGVYRDQEDNTSKSLTLDLRQYAE
ncbi:putative cohesin complex subunit and chromosome segregation protein [Kockovaella imperatae]|uniref:Structural maintenance of chromosomes protein n=1 Tax=Kockovaella imperatae TaxID=4999 RepID=A0A1Y1UPM5_9TREE|nr:putative cohesin complex subunit and chromosome segregation protein [Kockovaella imperatae]ORX39922.1 putative cohesin complex subunit and chromosome segregation protein [Kockovaella imperatae]